DLCQLVNADAPYWLVGMTEMTRTFGLELLESVLNDFPGVFLQFFLSVLRYEAALHEEMLDKVEPPSIPEGYAMSVAFSALLDLLQTYHERASHQQVVAVGQPLTAQPQGTVVVRTCS
ncbi:hypothetical protein XENOCAPTIV_008788, partial [Xenoophorus captivus]